MTRMRGSTDHKGAHRVIGNGDYFFSVYKPTASDSLVAAGPQDRQKSRIASITQVNIMNDGCGGISARGSGSGVGS